MADTKIASKEHQVFYQTPLALSLPFQRTSDTVKVFRYRFQIPDADLEFDVLSSSYVGPLFQTSQKTAVRIGDAAHQKRQKVLANFVAEEQITTNSFQNFVACHQNFFSGMIANDFNGKPLSSIPPTEVLPKPLEYKNLSKQYVLTNDFISQNFQQSLYAVSNPLSKTQSKPKTNRICLNRANNTFYVIRHIFEPSNTMQLSKFAEELFELYHPAEERLNSSAQTKTIDAFRRSDLDMKTPDLQFLSKPLADFLETLPDKSALSDIVKALSKAVISRDASDWKQASICMAIPAVKFGDFDYNYLEGCLNHQTNQELHSDSLASKRNQVVFLFSDNLLETPWEIRQFDSHLRIPCTLIQFQRMAQQFEYKAAMDFQFIKDHLMFKALSSRAQDPCNNNETLETLGDAALKALTIANLYVNNPEQDEGSMTTQKSRLVSNESLGECVNRTVAVFYLKDKYNKSKHFVPPMLKPVGEKEDVAAGQDDPMIIARKMLADCFEATVGAALVSTRRLFEPMLVIKKFGVLPRFNLRQYPGWLDWEFPKELEINYLIDCPLFNRDSTLGDVLSVSYCEDIFSVPPGIIYRANRDNDLDYAKRFPLKDFNNGVTKLQKLKESKQKQFAGDKAQFLARQQELLRLTQTEYLGYYFKELVHLSVCCSLSSNDQKSFDRMELLGDAIIEVLALWMARKIMLQLGKTMTPEILHSVKAVALSRHGLASIMIFHRLVECLKLKKPDGITETPAGHAKLFDYLMKKTFTDKCRDVNWREEDAAPKELGDFLEAMFGAIFIDGGWEPVYRIFNRLFSPLIFFICKYFDDMVVDLIHDVNTFFATTGHQHQFISHKENGMHEVHYCVTLRGEATHKVIGKSINKDEGKARKHAAVQAQEWINQELKKGKKGYDFHQGK